LKVSYFSLIKPNPSTFSSSKISLNMNFSFRLLRTLYFNFYAKQKRTGKIKKGLSWYLRRGHYLIRCINKVIKKSPSCTVSIWKIIIEKHRAWNWIQNFEYFLFFYLWIQLRFWQNFLNIFMNDLRFWVFLKLQYMLFVTFA
jgi:hypothetical protein